MHEGSIIISWLLKTFPRIYMIPNFFLHTAPDVLAIPEPVLASVEQGQSIEPHSCRVNLINPLSLEVGTGTASRRVVVTLMIQGATLQTRVVNNAEIIRFSTILYRPIGTAATPGLLYARVRQNNAQDIRRADILRQLNTPDYEVIEESPPENLGQNNRIVEIYDNILLRYPIREIQRLFANVFSTIDTIIIPGVAKFTGFRQAITTPSTSTFIAAPEEAVIHLPPPPGLVMMAPALPLADQQPLGITLPTLLNPQYWQPPILMTSASWTVIGVLWTIVLIACLISIGITYSWYLKQVL